MRLLHAHALRQWGLLLSGFPSGNCNGSGGPLGLCASTCEALSSFAADLTPEAGPVLPNADEGFGVHLVDVATSSPGSGSAAVDVEGIFVSRFAVALAS